MSEIRLHVLLSRAGVASRRKAEAYIKEGRVKVNGQVVQTLGAKADPERDTVSVDGVNVGARQPPTTLVLNKPVEVVTTLSDPEDRETVADLVAEEPYRFLPVGRLDYHTEGLLLMTTDGELSHRLLHPRYHVPKVYQVKVRGRPSPPMLDRLREGVPLEDGKTRPAVVQVLEEGPRWTWLEIVVAEGRNRLIRRMCDEVGHPALRVVRTELATIGLGALKPGQFRYLEPAELGALYGTAAMPVPEDMPERAQQAQRLILGAPRRGKGALPTDLPRRGPPGQTGGSPSGSASPRKRSDRPPSRRGRAADVGSGWITTDDRSGGPERRGLRGRRGHGRRVVDDVPGRDRGARGARGGRTPERSGGEASRGRSDGEASRRRSDGEASRWRPDGEASRRRSDGEASRWRSDGEASRWRSDGEASGWRSGREGRSSGRSVDGRGRKGPARDDRVERREDRPWARPPRGEPDARQAQAGPWRDGEHSGRERAEGRGRRTAGRSTGLRREGTGAPSAEHESASGRSRASDRASGRSRPSDRASGRGRASDWASGRGRASDRASGRGRASGRSRASDRASGRSRASDRASGRASDRASGRASNLASSRASDRASGRASDRASGRASNLASGRASDLASGRASGQASGRGSGRSSGRGSGRASGRGSGRSSGRELAEVSGRPTGRPRGRGSARGSGRPRGGTRGPRS